MHKIIFTLLIALFTVQLSKSQDKKQEVLLTIDGNKISRAEFERIYTKNNQEPAFDSASLAEYMKLFINFKLKVIEAEALGMDTLSSFITELKGYRGQLEKPYFTDDQTDEDLILESYERMKWNVRASHILILCDEKALPADTLKAYNKIADIRKKAVKGEDFEKLAKKYSEDKSVKKNGGDLGYFSAFAMIYPFESAAFNTPVGEISQIVRTKYGYHILKVVDKKEDKGKIKVAHLMRAIPQGSPASKDQQELNMINSIYDSIQAGASFKDLVLEYSDDRGTSRKGGELPYFGAGKMVPEFEEAAFNLKEEGEVSEPIKTAYGYHIIMLMDIKTLESYDIVKPIIKEKISKDERAKRGEEIVIKNLKTEYNLIINKEAFKPFYSVIDSSIYNGDWDAVKAQGLNETLFTLSDTVKYSQQDFANSISKDGIRRVANPLTILAEYELNRYIENCIINYEKSRLEIKYPGFKHLVKEYHDGILLFNLTDEMVWSKAVKDTVGLNAFYENNKNDYMWGDRVEATMYRFNNKGWEPKIVKLAIKVGKKNINVNDARTSFMKKAGAKDSTLILKVDRVKYSKGDNSIIDAVAWEPGIKEVQKSVSGLKDVYSLVYVNKTVGPEPKLLNEARGLITADYQNHLEKLWLDKLHTKYSVDINEDVLNLMIK